MLKPLYLDTTNADMIVVAIMTIFLGFSVVVTVISL